MSWFPSKIPSKAALLAMSPETYPFPLDGWPQELLSNGAKMGLKGNKLDKQLTSISEMALQQEEPIVLNWPYDKWTKNLSKTPWYVYKKWQTLPICPWKSPNSKIREQSTYLWQQSK